MSRSMNRSGMITVGVNLKEKIGFLKRINYQRYSLRSRCQGSTYAGLHGTEILQPYDPTGKDVLIIPVNCLDAWLPVVVLELTIVAIT
jgi:hypothetical protein